jgi:hypothetical protein
VCALDVDDLGLQVRARLASQGGLTAIVDLVLHTELAALRNKAVNALGTMAASPAVRTQLLAHLASPTPSLPADAADAAVVDLLCAQLTSVDAYALSDACFALGMLVRHDGAGGEALLRRLVPLLPAVEGAFVRSAPAYNTGRDKVDDLVNFSLVLVEAVRSRVFAAGKTATTTAEATAEAAAEVHVPVTDTCNATVLPLSAAFVEAAIVGASAANPRDLAFVQLVCTVLHTGAVASAEGKTILRETKTPARLFGLLRKHPRVRPYVQAVASAILAA